MAGSRPSSQTARCHIVHQPVYCSFDSLTLFSSFAYQGTKAQKDQGHRTSQARTRIRPQGSQIFVQCFYPTPPSCFLKITNHTSLFGHLSRCHSGACHKLPSPPSTDALIVDILTTTPACPQSRKEILGNPCPLLQVQGHRCPGARALR